MLIFDEDYNTIMLESVSDPSATAYFWVLDLAIRDYVITPLKIFEEITSEHIEIQVAGFRFSLPSMWNILVADTYETSQLDYIEIRELSGMEFSALVHGPNKRMIETETIITTNYFPSAVSVAPSLNKNQMLCHPIGPDAWINIAPSDTYNKYLKNAVAGDII